MPPMNSVEHDRYIAIMRWAKARYTRDGLLVTHTNNRQPTRYTRIEQWAWLRYMEATGYSTKGEARRDAGLIV